MATENKYLDKEGLKTFLGLIKENFAVKNEITEISNQITEVTETIETIADIPIENGSGENSMKLKGGGLETNFPNEFAIGTYNISETAENIQWKPIKGVWNKSEQNDASDEIKWTCETPNSDETFVIRCILNGVKSVTFKFRSDAEAEYDYAAISKLDTEILSYLTDFDIHQATTETTNGQWNEVTYNIPNNSEHFVDFAFGKDAATDELPDNAQIYISDIELTDTEAFPLFTIGDGTEGQPSNVFEVKSDGAVNIRDIYNNKENKINLQQELHSLVKKTEMPNYITLQKGEGRGSVAMKEGACTAKGTYSVALGSQCSANGNASIATGTQCVANQILGIARGQQSVADGQLSTAIGLKANASGNMSMAIGGNTKAQNIYEFACGYWNATSHNMYGDNPDNNRNLIGDYYNTLFSVGNGINEETRHNAFEIKQTGHIYIADVYGEGSYNGFDKPMMCLQDELHKVKEFRFFNISVEGTVTVKFVVEGEIIYIKSFTDTSVQIALPDNVTKFEEIVIEGDGKVTSCECPIVVDCSQPWERDCKVWKNTTFDFSTSAARSTITNKGGVKILNLNGWYTDINPTPAEITFGNVGGIWAGIAYSSGLEDSSWTFWRSFREELNRIHDKTGYTPMFWWNNADVLGLTDVGIDDEFPAASAIRLDKGGMPYITSSDFGPFRKLGWFDANDCTELDLSLPSLEVLLIGNLGCNLKVSKAHLDDGSIKFLGLFAKTVTNKTITFSGYNFYRMTEEQKKRFVDKGFNIAVDWDGDEVYKFMYDANNPTALAIALDSSERTTLIAENGMWLTEADDDVKGRTFANRIITNDADLWIQVTNEYKEVYEKKIKEEMNKKLEEMMKNR